MLTLCLLTCALGATESPCSFDWRGTKLRDALADVAQRLDASVVVDESVPPALLDQPVRMRLQFLTCEQALRWLARSAGLEAGVTDGEAMVTRTGRMPQEVLDTRTERAPETLPARSRRANVRWEGTPLSRVAVDVADSYGIDVIFHPAIVAEAPLVDLEMIEADLDHVVAAIADELSVTYEVADGAVWFFPGAARPSTAPAGRAATRPADQQEVAPAEPPAPATVATRPVAPVAPEPSAEPQLRPPAPATRPVRSTPPVPRPLEKTVRIDRSVSSWAQFAQRLQDATGVVCRVEAAGSAMYPQMEASGPAIDLLEAGRLSGWFTWRLNRSQDGLALQLLVQQAPGAP